MKTSEMLGSLAGTGGRPELVTLMLMAREGLESRFMRPRINQNLC